MLQTRIPIHLGKIEPEAASFLSDFHLQIRSITRSATTRCLGCSSASQHFHGKGSEFILNGPNFVHDDIHSNILIQYGLPNDVLVGQCLLFQQIDVRQMTSHLEGRRNLRNALGQHLAQNLFDGKEIVADLNGMGGPTDGAFATGAIPTIVLTEHLLQCLIIVHILSPLQRQFQHQLPDRFGILPRSQFRRGDFVHVLHLGPIHQHVLEGLTQLGRPPRRDDDGRMDDGLIEQRDETGMDGRRENEAAATAVVWERKGEGGLDCSACFRHCFWFVDERDANQEEEEELVLIAAM